MTKRKNPEIGKTCVAAFAGKRITRSGEMQDQVAVDWVIELAELGHSMHRIKQITGLPLKGIAAALNDCAPIMKQTGLYRCKGCGNLLEVEPCLICFVREKNRGES